MFESSMHVLSSLGILAIIFFYSLCFCVSIMYRMSNHAIKEAIKEAEEGLYE